ncbi:hypothetical protein [Peribacillus glennii]|uniref:Uncharacterized protein n=1 Tax=Peribacillus glennii TaxID=2303991 RepID=A0A372LC60_9BACI|nr:hypothetical protein [Peribacillus glennii]RFU63429.1 hypothetical protein D0466_11890 [Peribacillus glennii]
MKSYIVFLFQIIVWSGYTLAEWLSSHDRLMFKVIMFMVFCYFAAYIGKTILKSNRGTILVTCTSLLSYALLQLLFNKYLPQ